MFDPRCVQVERCVPNQSLCAFILRIAHLLILNSKLETAYTKNGPGSFTSQFLLRKNVLSGRLFQFFLNLEEFRVSDSFVYSSMV